MHECWPREPEQKDALSQPDCFCLPNQVCIPPSFDRAGLLPATKPLEMCLYLVRETEIVPWAAALRHLSQWKSVLQETEVLALINAFIQHIIGPIYNTIGWEDKGTHMEK